MDTTSGAYAHYDMKIRHSTFIIFVVGVVEIGAMKNNFNGFADIIDVRIEINACELKFHERKLMVESTAHRQDLYILSNAAVLRVPRHAVTVRGNIPIPYSSRCCSLFDNQSAPPASFDNDYRDRQRLDAEKSQKQGHRKSLCQVNARTG